MVNESGHPDDWRSNSGSLQPLPNITFQALERLMHRTEVLELMTGSPETHSYTCLTSEVLLFQLGPMDPGSVCNSTKSRGPRAPRAPPCPWPPSLVLMIPRVGGWGTWGVGDSRAHLHKGREAGRALQTELQVHCPWHIWGN